MSIEIVEKQIEKFLSDDTQGVLAICGKWGVGKTHFWNATITKLAGSEKTFKLPRYGYVSLFGINSLNNLKSELFTAIVDRGQLNDNGSADVEALLKDKLASLKSLGKKVTGALAPKLADRLLSNSASIADSLCFASIRQTVICIDDLERRSDSLDLRDVLGLASLLKEQKKCKVIFLLNDGEDGLEDFHKYHEKVVDLKLRCEPTAEECTRIALPGDGDDLTHLRDCISKLNITNIRTIKQIERVVKMATPLLKDYEPEIMRQAIHTIVLLGWCHYRADDPNIPPTTHVMRSEYALLGFGDSDRESSEEKLWNNHLQQYGYLHTDKLDEALMKGVVDGYFLEDDLRKSALEKNAEIVATRSSGSFHDAWDIYHESFADNQEEVVNTLFQSFKENVKYISPVNLNGMVTLFRELEEDEKADEAIELYVGAREPSSDVFNLSSYSFGGDITDDKTREKFDEVYQATVTEESLVEVLERIAERDSWNTSDEKFLAERSVDDFQQVFSSEVGPQLSKYVARCLQFGRYGNASEQQQKIGENATEALKRLAAGNKLNQLRIKKFGVSISER